MKNTVHSENGFTLLEVLVALSIFAVAGMVSLQAYLSSVRHVQIMTEEKNYLLLSALKIEEFKMEIEEVEEESTGVFPEPFEGYEWSLELSDTTIIDTELGMTFIPYKLTVNQGNREFSTLAPFLKTIEEESTQRIE